MGIYHLKNRQTKSRANCMICGNEFRPITHNQVVCDFEPCRIAKTRINNTKSSETRAAKLKSYQTVITP